MRIEAKEANLQTAEASQINHLGSIGLLRSGSASDARLALTLRSPNGTALKSVFVHDDWIQWDGNIDALLGSLSMRDVEIFQQSSSASLLSLKSLVITRIGSEMFHAAAVTGDGQRYEWTHPRVAGLLELHNLVEVH